VEFYFNYMGLLAVEGSYDSMYALIKTGIAPIDVILLMAAKEGDVPKVQELVDSGADIAAKDQDGKDAFELAGLSNPVKRDDILEILNAAKK